MEIHSHNNLSLRWTLFTLTIIQLLCRTLQVPKEEGLILGQSSVSQFQLSFAASISHRHVDKRYRIYYTNSTTKVSLLLLIAGDVNPNPGPDYKPKYPCIVCKAAAKWGQDCLECECCKNWFHVQCLGMNNAVYNVLANHPSYSWICCDCGMPNFSTSLFSFISARTENRFNSLSDMSSGDSDMVYSLPQDDNIGTPTRSSSPYKDKIIS